MSATRSSCYKGFTQREAVVTSPAEWCNGACMDCCWQPEPYTTDPGTKPKYLHSEPSPIKSIKLFNLSSLVENSAYFALAPDLSCSMILRVDRAAVLDQRSTMAELSCVQACTTPVMWCYTSHISSCTPVFLQGISLPSCLSSGLHLALCRRCHQKGAIKTHGVGQQEDSKSKARSFPLPGNV